MAKLIVKEGPSKVMEYELTDEVKVVGRDRTNDIRINHALVSRNHAQFFKQNNGYAIRDLESKNGTFVNNAQLTAGVAHPLKDGDQVRIGPTTFVFSAETAAPSPAGGAPAGAEADGGPSTRVLDPKQLAFDPAKAGGIDELKAAQRQTQILLEVCKAFSVAHDPRSLHQALLQAVNDHLAPQRAFLFRMSENNSSLQQAGQLLAPGENAGQPLMAARLAVAQAIRDKAGVIRTGLMTAEQTGGQAENRVQLAAPLLTETALLGVIYIDAREQVRPYKLPDLRLLVGMAQLAAEFLARSDSKGGPRSGSFSGAALDQMRREAALLGNGAAVAGMRAYAAKAAASNAPLLLFGPPGCGKQHLARLIHLSGPRAAHPFVIVSGPALPKSLTETVLFGQESEEAPPQPGRIEWAEGGTVFIDQLQEVSLAAQERLFLLVSKGQSCRVGSETPRAADVRLVVSTNVDPKEFVGHRLFHQPLIQALGENMYELPGLAARREDVPLLAEHFLERARTKSNRKLRGFSDEALAALSAYEWPGNLHELNLTVQSAVFRGADREITAADLPAHVSAAAATAAQNGSPATGAPAHADAVPAENAG